MTAAWWDPWAEARRRRTLRPGRFAVFRTVMPGGLPGAIRRIHGRTIILLDRGLSAVGQRCVLTEELVHDERAIGEYLLSAPVRGDQVANAQEEHRVRRLTQARLVPEIAVAAIVAEIHASGEFNPWLWADDLDVLPELLFEHLAVIGRAFGPIDPWWSI